MKYDLAISFSGAQRAYVQRCRELLGDLGIRAFFDEDHGTMVGSNLVRVLPEIYGSGVAKHCVVFLSQRYLQSDYTRLEFEAALQRRSQGDDEYIILVRCDDTEVPEALRGVAYIDGRACGPTIVAYRLAVKLGRAIPKNAAPEGEVVIQITDRGHLDLELLRVTFDEFWRSRRGRFDRIEPMVRLPDSIARWRDDAVAWMAEHRGPMIARGQAVEKAFEQVTEVVERWPLQCTQDIGKGVAFLLQYALEDFRRVPFDDNPLAIGTMAAFAEARFHQLSRSLDHHRITGMERPPWSTSAPYGDLTFSPKFAESLALRDVEYERVALWVQCDAECDSGGLVEPSQRPFVPFDVVVCNGRRVSAEMFSTIIAPQFIANSADCAPYFIQALFRPGIDHARRVRIFDRGEQFLDKEVGKIENLSNLHGREKQGLVARLRGQVEQLPGDDECKQRLASAVDFMFKG